MREKEFNKIKELMKEYYKYAEYGFYNTRNIVGDRIRELEEENKKVKKVNDKIDNQNEKMFENINELEERINKAIHLINHNDITDYRVFESDLLKILKGE